MRRARATSAGSGVKAWLMIATWSAPVYQQRDQGTRYFARRKPCPEESTTALMGLDQYVCILVPLMQVGF